MSYDVNKIRERAMIAEKKAGKGQFPFYKWKGVNKFRMIDAIGDEGSFGKDIGAHWPKKGVKIWCPKACGFEELPCEQCEKVSALRQSEVQEERDQASRMNHKNKTLFLGFDLDNINTGIQLIEFPISVAAELYQVISSEAWRDTNIVDLAAGVNMTINRTGSGEMDTRYSAIIFDRGNSRIPNEALPLIPDTLVDLNEVVKALMHAGTSTPIAVATSEKKKEGRSKTAPTVQTSAPTIQSQEERPGCFGSTEDFDPRLGTCRICPDKVSCKEVVVVKIEESVAPAPAPTAAPAPAPAPTAAPAPAPAPTAAPAPAPTAAPATLSENATEEEIQAFLNNKLAMINAAKAKR